MTRQITIEEVKKHKRKSSVWMIIHNDVYDVTSFLEEHPGGEESLTAFAGKDATQVFEDVNHSEDARELMKKYKIGSLPLEQQHAHIDPCRSEPAKQDGKKIKFEPKSERRLSSIVVPSECSIPPRHCRPRRFPCGGPSDLTDSTIQLRRPLSLKKKTRLMSLYQNEVNIDRVISLGKKIELEQREQSVVECNKISNYKWLLLALAGAIILGVVLKKHLAR